MSYINNINNIIIKQQLWKLCAYMRGGPTREGEEAAWNCDLID